MLFENIRKDALGYWLTCTRRKRQSGDDIITESFECSWQLGFLPLNAQSADHYSIFCSMGEWNTMVTDFLEDARFDGLDLSIPQAHPQLFRHYTSLCLLVSEIMTDFQDVLTIFFKGDTTRASGTKNNHARATLADLRPEIMAVQHLFDYINNVCKHKTRNIHFCNHHMDLCFEDSGDVCAMDHAIRVGHVDEFLPSKPGHPAARIATSIIIPELIDILRYVVDGYFVVDAEFRKDPPAFEHFRKHYHRVLPAPADLAPGPATPK